MATCKECNGKGGVNCPDCKGKGKKITEASFRRTGGSASFAMVRERRSAASVTVRERSKDDESGKLMKKLETEFGRNFQSL